MTTASNAKSRMPAPEERGERGAGARKNPASATAANAMRHGDAVDAAVVDAHQLRASGSSEVARKARPSRVRENSSCSASEHRDRDDRA